jgi:Flp pilus assembly pilin Flp
MTKHIINRIWAVKVWSDTRGQDILEYALFVASITVLYVAFSPNVATSVSTVFSKISSTVSTAATTN